jgi:hypothetical protein
MIPLEIKRIRGVCKFNGKVTWARLNPVSFTLAPGKAQRVKVSILSKGASPGKHDLAITAAVVLGHKGHISVVGTVAPQMLVTVPGAVPKRALKPCVTLTEPPGVGLSGLAIGGVVIAIVAVLTLLLLLLKRFGPRIGIR